MTLPAKSREFILEPAADPALAEPDIKAALEAYRAFLAAAVAKPGDHAAFASAHTTFTELYERIAQKLRITGADSPEYFQQAWWFNLSALGFQATGLTAEDIRRRLDSLPSPFELTTRLGIQLDLSGRDSDRFEDAVSKAAAALLKHFWWLLSDTTLDGIKVSEPAVQAHNAVDHSWGCGLMLSLLTEKFPLSEDRDLDYSIWRYNIYRLTLQLLGYQPAS